MNCVLVEVMIKTFALLAQKSVSAQISIYHDSHNCNTVFDGSVNIGSHCKKQCKKLLVFCVIWLSLCL